MRYAVLARRQRHWQSLTLDFVVQSNSLTVKRWHEVLWPVSPASNACHYVPSRLTDARAKKPNRSPSVAHDLQCLALRNFSPCLQQGAAIAASRALSQQHISRGSCRKSTGPGTLRPNGYAGSALGWNCGKSRNARPALGWESLATTLQPFVAPVQLSDTCAPKGGIRQQHLQRWRGDDDI